MAALSQYNPLHYIFPTAQQQAEIIFLSLWNVYRGWESRMFQYKQQISLFRLKNLTTLIHKFSYYNGTHTYYKNLGQIFRLNCAGTKLMNAKCQIKPS
jgi:NADH dehydrogenase FAD-containing subunit